MNLSFATRKLKGSIKRVNQKVSKLDVNPEDYNVFGVSKADGVSITGKDIGKNLNTYYYFKGKKFAYNPYRVNIGSIGLSDESFEGLMSSAYVIFETTDEINDEFLLLYLKSPLGLNLIKWYGDRGGVRSALRFKDLEKIDFPNLTYQEQSKALEIIKSKQSIVDKLNIELEHQNELIIKLRQSILQDAVQGNLTANWREKNLNIEPASELLNRIKKEKEQLIADKKIKKEKPLPPINKDEIPSELPNGWEWCKLGDTFEIVRGSSPRPKGDSRYWSKHRTPFHWITIADFTPFSKMGFLVDTKEFLTEEGKNYSREVGTLDLLIACSGVGSVGRSVKLDIHGFIYDGIIAIRQINSEIIRDYIGYFIKLKESEIYSITTGGSWLNINTDLVKNYFVGFPPLEEQKAIVKKVNKLMAHCDQLDNQVEESRFQAEQLMQAVLQDVFNPKQKENSDDLIEALFPELETIAEVANLQQAMIIQKTELGLGSGRGKVYAQKTSANLKNIFDVDIPYTFEKSHHGEFSYQLSEDLDKNPYLRKVKTEVGEIYEVKNNKQQEVLNALNKPENASFIQSVDELLKVYQNDLIKGSTDRIELLNTVWRAIKDTKSLIGNTVYKYLEEWEIQQGAYKTKADKFTKSETFAMITLIKDLGWDKKIIHS